MNNKMLTKKLSVCKENTHRGKPSALQKMPCAAPNLVMIQQTGKLYYLANLPDQLLNDITKRQVILEAKEYI